MLDAPLHKFTIAARPDSSQVAVDGEPVGGVLAYRVEADSDRRVPVLTLWMDAEGDLKMEGIVRIADPSLDQGDIVAAFLDNIDPNELEKVALRDHAMGTTLTGKMLQILARWARGDE